MIAVAGVEIGATAMQTTRQLFWDRRTMALTGTLWVILFAGAWLLGHGSSAPTPSGAPAVNSGLSTAARASSAGSTLPGLAAVPNAPALAPSAPVASHRVRPAGSHKSAATTAASTPVRSVVVAPVAPVTPVRRSTTIVPTSPVVSHPSPPTSVPTHTTSTPPTTHPSPPPSGGTGTVSGGG